MMNEQGRPLLAALIKATNAYSGYTLAPPHLRNYLGID